MSPNKYPLCDKIHLQTIYGYYYRLNKRCISVCEKPIPFNIAIFSALKVSIDGLLMIKRR